MEPGQAALNTSGTQVTLIAQFQNELFMLRPDLGTRRTMRLSRQRLGTISYKILVPQQNLWVVCGAGKSPRP